MIHFGLHCDPADGHCWPPVTQLTSLFTRLSVCGGQRGTVCPLRPVKPNVTRRSLRRVLRCWPLLAASNDTLCMVGSSVRDGIWRKNRPPPRPPPDLQPDSARGMSRRPRCNTVTRRERECWERRRRGRRGAATAGIGRRGGESRGIGELRGRRRLLHGLGVSGGGCVGAAVCCGVPSFSPH